MKISENSFKNENTKEFDRESKSYKTTQNIE